MSTIIESKELVVFKKEKLDLSKNVKADIKDVLADFKSDKSLKSYSVFAKDLEVLSDAYSDLVKKEITPELAKEARELRLKVKKVRSSNTNAVDADKAKYQASINLLNAVKNKVIAVASYMEGNLDAIEKYEEIIEKDRLALLDANRKLVISNYRLVLPNETFALLSEDDFNAMVAGLELAKKEKEKAELKAQKEREKALKITEKRDKRKREILPFISVMDAEQKTIDLAELTEAKFKALLSELKAKQKIQIDNANKYAKIVEQRENRVEMSIKASSKSKKELVALWFSEFAIPEPLLEIKDDAVVKGIISKFEMFVNAAKADINRMK